MQSNTKVEERISRCEEILSNNPDSVIFAALSDAYLKKGELAKAFHICNRGLKSHPDYGAGRLVMARINMERGMYSEAEKELALAVRADGETRATELLLAQILVKKERIRDAKKILEKLKDSDPTNEVVAELLEIVEEQERLEKSGYEAITAKEHWNLEKVADLKDAVRYLKSLPGVMGALAVTDDGAVLESKLRSDLNRETIGAVATSITQSVRTGISGVGWGEYEQIMVEAENLELWIIDLNKKAFVLCCDSEASKGVLKMRVIELTEHLCRNDG